MKHLFQKAFSEFRSFTRNARRNSIGMYAAQSSFFLIISSVPLLMLLLTSAQFILPITEEGLLTAALSIFPENFTEFMTNIIKDLFRKQAIPLISISALMLLWSASRGVLSVMRGLRRIYHAGNLKFYKERFRAILYTIALVLTLLFALLVLVFGDALQTLLQTRYDILANATALFVMFKFLLSALLISLFALLIYTAMAPRSFPLLSQLPGALFCTFGWILFSFGFSIYINNFSNYSYIYGSLTAVILLMLWLYFCMWFLFLGAQINITISEQHKDHAQIRLH